MIFCRVICIGANAHVFVRLDGARVQADARAIPQRAGTPNINDFLSRNVRLEHTICDCASRSAPRACDVQPDVGQLVLRRLCGALWVVQLVWAEIVWC